MPKSALKPCAKAGCGTLVERKDRFCEPHGGNSNWQDSQARKGSVTERGYGHSWRKLRGQILKRDNYICQNHIKQGRYVPGNEVDHITNKAQGGTDDPDNLQTLCNPCHRAKTATESKRAGRHQSSTQGHKEG